MRFILIIHDPFHLSKTNLNIPLADDGLLPGDLWRGPVLFATTDDDDDEPRLPLPLPPVPLLLPTPLPVLLLGPLLLTPLEPPVPPPPFGRGPGPTDGLLVLGLAPCFD